MNRCAAGVYASSGEYRFFGDLAVNACDDLAVGYTKSSSSMYPGIYYTGRQSGDPAGILQAEAQLKAGEVTYTAFDSVPRPWDDYTEMTIDPDGVTFWYLGEYSKNTGKIDGRWGTCIGAFTYSCDPGSSPPPPPDPGSSMRVSDLDDAGSINGGRTWTARVTVTIVDSGGNLASDATVTGVWDVLRSDGTCTVEATNVRKNVSSATFAVTGVTHATLTYEPSANTDPDGDSDGTTITVFK